MLNAAGVVTLVDIPGSDGLVLQHPRGTVGVIVKSPTDHEHSYRVRFPDGFEAPLKRNEVTMLARFKEGEIGDSTHAVAHAELLSIFDRAALDGQCAAVDLEKSERVG